jgi:prepilin-type N-terminal cleavage/methylation domain-containing protein
VGKRFNNNSNIVKHPFSLVEMLVVIAIIAILAGVGAGGYTAAQRWIAKSSTESLLAKLKIAIESYKNDKGYYPLPHTDPDTAVVSTANAPNLKLDTITKDFTSSPLSGDEHQPRNNMNNFIDYGKIKDDQSFKHNSGNCNYYYMKDGWNAPMKTKATLVGGSQTDLFGPIKYRCPGIINKTSFDLYSAGHDRKFAADPDEDMEDDIYVQL